MVENVDFNYIGLKATSPGGEFDVFLGVDPGVKVEFKPVKVKEGKAGLIKKSKTENTAHKITISNNKAAPVRGLKYST
jgi:hypothetical protein